MIKDSPLTSQGFRQLTIVTSGWILLLIFVGALAHAATTGGAGCSDWPWCYHQPILPTQFTVWLEFIHRGVAGIAALLTITIAIMAWRDYRQYRFIFGPALGAVVITFIQIFLGAALVWMDNQPLVRGAHLLAAMLTLGFTLFVTTTASLPAKDIAKIGITGPNHRFYFRSILLTGVGFLLLLTTGAIVTDTGTGLACSDWPLCRGEIFPADFSLDIAISLLHRFTVVAVGALVAAVVLQTQRRYRQYRPLTGWSKVLGFLFLAQIGVGGLYSLTDIPYPISAVHLGLTAAIWGSLVGLASISYLTLETALPQKAAGGAGSVPPPRLPSPLPVRQRAKTFFKLTKPWILVLLLITTMAAMVIAAKGLPPISLLLYTLLGGALSASGASVLNSYLDADIDGLMSRTSRRATVTGLVTPQETLLFGLILSVSSFLIFAVFVNTLSAILSTIGILYYVFFYTLYLKRTTIHNIIIGGAAGAIPPLVGWTAVTNSLDLGALYLFAIIFFWTPPHTWALALLVKKDYARARVPMLPVVVGEKETTYQIFLYTLLLMPLTLLPFTFNMLSLAYLIVAMALGAVFIHLAWKLWRNYNKSVSKQLYKFSQAYLALLFLAMALDRSLF